MLKTTMLVAGLAASSGQLVKKECSGSTTLTNADLGTFDCKDAKTGGTYCAVTKKTTETHFGGGIVCVEDKLSGATAGTGCFQYEVRKSCPLLVKSTVVGWGCDVAADTISASDINVDATTNTASYTCTIKATHALYTEVDGVKTYTDTASTTVLCNHLTGEWTAPKLSTEGVCTAPTLSSDDLKKYWLATTATTVLDITADTADRDAATDVDEMLVYSDGNPTGAKICGAGTEGKAKAADAFPKVVKGESCVTMTRRDGGDGTEAHFGAFTCIGGSSWELPKKMCALPARSLTTDTYLTNKLVGDGTAAADAAAGFHNDVVCGTPTQIQAAETSTGLDRFGIPNGADLTAPGFIPQTSDNYKCYFDIAGGTHGYAEVTCTGGNAILDGALPTSKQLCETGALSTASGTDAGDEELTYTGAVDGKQTANVARKMLERTETKFDIPGASMGGLQDASGDMSPDDGSRRTYLNCVCGTDGKYACTKVEGCKATTAATTYTVEGRTISCGNLAAADKGGTNNCAATGDYVAGTVKCNGPAFVGSTGGGKKCADNATATAEVQATQTSRGYSWNCPAQLVAGQCSSNIVPDTGRTTCEKARWSPGYLSCDLKTGKWSIQDDFSKCEGSAGSLLSAAQLKDHNFKSYSIGHLPGSEATVVCADGFGEGKVKNAAGADTMIRMGSGKCSTDNLGTTKFVPCLKSCNSSKVADDLNKTSVGIDIAGTDCAGLKVWNNNSANYQYECKTKAQDKFTGGRVYCDGKSGMFKAEDAKLKVCSIPSTLTSGTIGNLCTEAGAKETGTSYLDEACKLLGLVTTEDRKEVDKESEAYKATYDCTGVTADGAKCTVVANKTNFDVTASCCTTNACLSDAKCYQPGKDTRDMTEGCWKFEVKAKESSASIIGAGIVTLLALFHL